MMRDPREVAEEIDDLDEYSAVAEVIRADRRALVEEAKRRIEKRICKNSVTRWAEWRKGWNDALEQIRRDLDAMLDEGEE